MDQSFKDAVRRYDSPIAAAEKRLLRWLAARMPAAVNSDHLTMLALFSMFMVGVCYAVSNRMTTAFAWVVVWLVLNWLGDSLDGTLARVRGQQRPRYGFYVDHMCDSFGALFVVAGLAVSGLMTPLVAAAVLIAYFLLSIEIFLATYCVGTFQMSFWGAGPTELRILMAIGTLTLYVKPIVTVAGHRLTLFDAGGIVAAIALTMTAIVATVRHVRELYQAEPLVSRAAGKAFHHFPDDVLRVAE